MGNRKGQRTSALDEPHSLEQLAAHCYTGAIMANALISTGRERVNQEGTFSNLTPPALFEAANESFRPLWALLVLQRLGRAATQRAALRHQTIELLADTLIKEEPEQVQEPTIEVEVRALGTQTVFQDDPSQAIEISPPSPEVSNAKAPTLVSAPKHSTPSANRLAQLKRQKERDQSFPDSPYRAPVVGDRHGARGSSVGAKSSKALHFSVQTVRDLRLRKQMDANKDLRNHLLRLEEQDREFIISMQRGAFEALFYQAARARLALAPIESHSAPTRVRRK